MKTLLTVRSLLIIATLIAFAGVAQAKGGKRSSKKAVAAAAPATPSVPAVSLISVQEETFSLPIADAAALLRKFPSDAERYNELVRRADAKQARLERLIMLRTISGQQAKAESVNELIYPTEYGPPRAAGESSTAPSRAFTPGGFQTRSLGDTLNLTPQINPDGRTIAITLIPENSFFAGYKGAGNEKWAHQPVMGTARLTTSVVVKDGEPFLLGTFTPPFNNGIVPQQKEHRIWLDFITAHVIPSGK